MLARLAHVIARRRWYVIGAWLALTVFGGYAAGQVSNRWFQSFSIPGYSAYEANQRMLQQFGTGERSPTVVIFRARGDATNSEAIREAMERAAKANPGSRTSSTSRPAAWPMSPATGTRPSSRSTPPARSASIRRAAPRRPVRTQRPVSPPG